MSRKSILARMFEAFAKDAEPEEVLEAAKAVDACGSEPKEEAKDTRTYDEDMEMVMDAIHELNEKLEAMQNENAAHHAEEAQDADIEEEEEEKLTGLDAVEEAIKARMTGQDADYAEEEESVEIDPEEINEDEEPEEVDEEEAEIIESDDEDIEEEAKLKAADSSMSMAMLRAIKPIIASMPRSQRKRATDALNRAVKKSMRVKVSQPLPGGYGALSKRKKTADASANDLRAFGEACRKRNPHNNKKD